MDTLDTTPEAAICRADHNKSTPADEVGWALHVLADNIDKVPTALAMADESDIDEVSQALRNLNLSRESVEQYLVELDMSYPSDNELPDCLNDADRLLQQVEIELAAHSIAHRERTY